MAKKPLTPQQILLKRVGERLQQMRGNYSTAHAEQVSGVSKSYIIRAEKGLVNPSITILQALAKGYGTTLGELFQPWVDIGETPENAMLHAKVRELLSSSYRDAIRVNIEAVYLLYKSSNRRRAEPHVE